MKFELFQRFMNSGLSRDELLAIFLVSFSVFLFFTYWKIRPREMSKHDADANDERKETGKINEDKRKHP